MTSKNLVKAIAIAGLILSASSLLSRFINHRSIEWTFFACVIPTVGAVVGVYLLITAFIKEKTTPDNVSPKVSPTTVIVTLSMITLFLAFVLYRALSR